MLKNKKGVGGLFCLDLELFFCRSGRVATLHITDYANIYFIVVIISSLAVLNWQTESLNWFGGRVSVGRAHLYGLQSSCPSFIFGLSLINRDTTMIEAIIGWSIFGLLVAAALVPVLYLLAAVAVSIVSLGNMGESDND